MRVCACGPLSVCLSHSHSHTQTYTHTLSLSLSVQPTQVTVVTAREAKVPEDMLVIAGVGCIKFFSLTGQPLGSHSDDHMDQNDGAPVSIRLDLELSLSRPLSTSLSFDLSLSQPLDLSRPLSTSLLTSLLTSLSFAHAPQFFAPPLPTFRFPHHGQSRCGFEALRPCRTASWSAHQKATCSHSMHSPSASPQTTPSPARQSLASQPLKGCGPWRA